MVRVIDDLLNFHKHRALTSSIDMTEVSSLKDLLEFSIIQQLLLANECILQLLFLFQSIAFFRLFHRLVTVELSMILVQSLRAVYFQSETLIVING